MDADFDEIGAVWRRNGVGETQEQPFQLSFNRWLRVDFQGSCVSSDAGLLMARELDERSGFDDLIEQHLADGRGKNTQLPLTDMVRQSVYGRLAGYKDVNDAERPSQDPTFRLIGSRKIWERGAALTSRLQWFETELLTQAENLAGLAWINRELCARAQAIDSPGRVVLDLDSTEAPVYGRQEASAYNATSNPPAITHSCCPTARAIVWRPSSGRAMSIVPRAGRKCCQRCRTG